MPRQKKKGYMVTIRDGGGQEQKFYSTEARSHEQGNSLASSLIEHFSRANPGVRFATTDVSPSNGEIGVTDVKWTRIDRLVW